MDSDLRWKGRKVAASEELKELRSQGIVSVMHMIAEVTRINGRSRH